MLWRSYVLLAAQVRLEHAAKQLQQDLKADLGDGGIVSALAQLIADKRVLRPRKLMPASDDASLAHLGADQVPSGIGYVGILDAKDHGDFALELAKLVQSMDAVGGSIGGRVGTRVGAERTAVDVGGKVSDASGDARVKLDCISAVLMESTMAYVRQRGRPGGRLDTCPWRQ